METDAVWTNQRTRYFLETYATSLIKILRQVLSRIYR